MKTSSLTIDMLCSLSLSLPRPHPKRDVHRSLLPAGLHLPDAHRTTTHTLHSVESYVGMSITAPY